MARRPKPKPPVDSKPKPPVDSKPKTQNGATSLIGEQIQNLQQLQLKNHHQG
ncbi:hypothetical protein [Calothrix sp. PCC 6303]|uniref:hypothetical protein n=1 Tax=Calothrix sp. PCC 6303 TaxID=1170562 RepID=UPI0002A04011|nr:hypothetical protein [Calothrix sp. PCC 6303]AFZ03398.1 hypothetical protein Cal6303_4497 [Calothrix sp. PCC 6303]